MSKRILFFGNERLATGVATDAPILRGLVAAGYDVAALVISQSEIGSSRQTRDTEVARWAETQGIPVLSPANVGAATEQLASYQAEAAILVAYGQLVPQIIIDLFPKGIINIHPSLLPLHRGSIPIESVILNGETETGVSLMALSSEMDAGPVYAQQSVVLSRKETKRELAQRLTDLGGELLVQHLPAILDGSLQAQPQDAAHATYDERLSKADSVLDFSQPAVQLEREIRAYLQWPRSRTKLGSFDIIITAAHVQPGEGTAGSLWQDGQHLGVHTSDDILIIDTLVPSGKKEMTAEAFLAGYRNKL